MFGSDKKKAQSMQENSTMERNRISKKSVFKGSITSQGDFRIDGTVEGDLTTTGKVIIGPDGKVYGKVRCVNADIEGYFEGHLEVKNSLCLKPSAKVAGDIFMESLTVEPGAIFNANCRMLSTIKELNPATSEQPKEAKEREHNVSEIS
ncbi:bactofilin family protein [Wenyingzhuangia heitensis]|nr:polymer-forming cytoskeletal protein [Wenyingzhuangia heitensis]